MKYNGLFIGLTTIDIQYFVDEFPESNKKIKTNAPEILVGGPATNAAVAFAKLNNGAFLASALGQNSFSKFFELDFKQTNVSHFDIIKQQKLNPVIASVVTSNNGERNIFTHNPEKIKPNITVEELFNCVSPDIILLDGFYPEFSIDCARLAHKNRIPVVLDCGSWKPQYNNIFEFTDVVICSDDFHPPACHNSDQVLQYIQKNKVNKIAITRGGGNIIFTDKKRGNIAVETVEVKDSLGAGDFLHGAFCYYYLQLGNFEAALKNASELASYSCRFKGTRKWLNND